LAVELPRVLGFLGLVFGTDGEALALDAEVDVVPREAGEVGGDDQLIALIGDVDAHVREHRLALEAPTQLTELLVHSFDQFVEFTERVRSSSHTTNLDVERHEYCRREPNRNE